MKEGAMGSNRNNGATDKDYNEKSESANASNIQLRGSRLPIRVSVPSEMQKKKISMSVS